MRAVWLCWIAVTLVAVALLFGVVAVVGYQEIYSLRHNGVWPDLRFIDFWHWARLDPAPLGRLFGPATAQWMLHLPLWAGLVTPCIVVGWIAIKLGQWVHRDERRRAEIPPDQRGAA